jgi:general L-amino acid transport system permease protein
MAETLAAAPPRPPLWRNVLFRRIVGQVVFAVLLVVVFRELFLNLEFNVAQRNQTLSFGFLDSQAGFPIGERGGIDYNTGDPISRAFIVGLANTLRVSALGIALATILGLLIGVARLSPNWLVRRISQMYVDVVRNTPVLIQIVFWWTAVFLAIPTIQNSLSFFGVAYLSNRGAVIPWFRLEEGASVWRWFLLAAVVAAVVLWRWRTRLHESTGQPHRRVRWSLGAFVAITAVGFVVTGTPMDANVPQVLERSYEGGVRFSPEFAALLVGLVIYTAAFIAEIIRGSIQAVPKGQREAAEALGLSRWQQLRFVILPQALRIAVPAINSQYLNLMKNSSLALAIGFPELALVSSSIINQRGHEPQVLLLMMGTYLAISLTISVFMNVLNRSVTTKGARR